MHRGAYWKPERRRVVSVRLCLGHGPLGSPPVGIRWRTAQGLTPRGLCLLPKHCRNCLPALLFAKVSSPRARTHTHFPAPWFSLTHLFHSCRFAPCFLPQVFIIFHDVLSYNHVAPSRSFPWRGLEKGFSGLRSKTPGF